MGLSLRISVQLETKKECHSVQVRIRLCAVANFGNSHHNSSVLRCSTYPAVHFTFTLLHAVTEQ